MPLVVNRNSILRSVHDQLSYEIRHTALDNLYIKAGFGKAEVIFLLSYLRRSLINWLREYVERPVNIASLSRGIVEMKESSQ